MLSPLPHLNANAVVERIRTNSVLNPLLWLCGIIELSAIPAACLSNGYAKVFFCALAAFPVIAAIIAYFVWMFRDPNRLQSEDYQLEKQRILQGAKEEDDLPAIGFSADHDSKKTFASDSDAPDDPPKVIEHASPEASDNGGV
jgi:hypothetical protein